MNLLYVSEHRFIKSLNGEIYTTGQMGEKYFSRFKNSFKRVTVIGLCEDETHSNRIKRVERINCESDFLRYHLIRKSPNQMFGKISDYFKIKKAYKDCLKFYDRVATKAPSLIAGFVSRVAKNNNILCYVELVGCPWDSYWHHSFRGKIIAPIAWLITRKAVKDSPYVVYVTNKYLQDRYPNHNNNISCSNVYLEDFNENILNHRVNEIKKLNKKSKIIIGTIGAINVRYKGQQYMIKALEVLKNEGFSNLEYQLVGGGDPSYLTSVAKEYNVLEQVKFLGPKPHAEIFQWLDTITLYVQPSTTEGLPRALIEAMSRGIPAFGAASGGIVELLDSEMIFSNSKNRVHEMCSIIMSLSKEKMIVQAIRNYNESKNYNYTLINKRRNNFIEQFSSCKN